MKKIIKRISVDRISKDVNTIIIMLILVTIFSCANLFLRKNYLNNSYKVKSNEVKNEQTEVCAINELFNHTEDFEDLKELLIDNPYAHNSIFRGEDVTKYYTDGSLYDRIKGANGYNIFDDLYVGDYIYKYNTYWRIAGFDMYMNKGDGGDNVPPLTVHHAVIVPDFVLITAQMNSLDENDQPYTTGGYVASQMYTTTLPSVLSTYIEPVFGTHILTYRNLLTTETTSGRISRYGNSTNVSSNWAWQTRKLDIMNENQVTGSIMWSSSGYETGSDNIQFPLFALKPEYVVAKNASGSRWNYWLRNVATSIQFAYVNANGDCGSSGGHASNSYGVRPYFYID